MSSHYTCGPHSRPPRQICTMILGGRVADVFGGKWVYGGGLFLSAALSLFTPLLLLRRRDAWAAFGLRLAQGCLQGGTLPALHAIYASKLAFLDPQRQEPPNAVGLPPVSRRLL